VTGEAHPAVIVSSEGDVRTLEGPKEGLAAAILDAVEATRA
jgi:hypothetical protein